WGAVLERVADIMQISDNIVQICDNIMQICELITQLCEVIVHFCESIMQLCEDIVHFCSDPLSSLMKYLMPITSRRIVLIIHFTNEFIFLVDDFEIFF